MAEASRATRELKARLDHPIVDADAHQLEVLAVVMDFVRDVGGPEMPDRLIKYFMHRAAHVPPDARRAARPAHVGARVVAGADREHHRPRHDACCPAISTSAWTRSASTSRSCTPARACWSSRCPAWPTTSCARRAPARSTSTTPSSSGRTSDRLTPAAVIPMHTPEEAIEELDFAIGELGLKAVVFAGDVLRPVPAVRRRASRSRATVLYQDCFGIDSPFDYDPVWRKCIELKVAPTFHSGPIGWGTPRVVHAAPVQPDRRLRRGRRGARQGAVLRRRDAAVPEAAPRLPRGRRHLGAELVLPHDRALGEAQRRSDHDPRPGAPRHRAVRRADRQVRPSAGAGDPRPGRAGLALVRSSRGARRLARRASIEHERRSPSCFVPHFYFGCEGDDRMVAAALRHERSIRSARASTRCSAPTSATSTSTDMREVVRKAYETGRRGPDRPSATSATSRSPTRCDCTAA